MTVQKKLDQILTRLDLIDERINKIDHKLDRANMRIDQLESKYDKFAEIDFMLSRKTDSEVIAKLHEKIEVLELFKNT